MCGMPRVTRVRLVGICQNRRNGTDDFSFNALSAGGRYPDGRSFSQGILVPNMVPFTPG